MNKKILMSLSVIAAAAAAVVGGTGAFFSDTETSTGNTFTAGAIDLKVDSQQRYNNAVCVNGEWALAPGAQATNPQYPVLGDDCGGAWGLTDLGPTNKFFDFTDVKPGDNGSNSISLHVFNNDAWVCATVSNLSDLDNTLTEPEDPVDADNLLSGELKETMIVTIWKDTDGDNVQDGGESVLYTGPAQAGTWALYDSITGTPLSGETTAWLGVKWDLPLGTGNEVQTDSLSADMSFQVVQSRNNAQFVCGEDTVVVTSDDLAESVQEVVTTPSKWLFYNDSNNTVMTINQFSGNGGVNDIVAGPDSVGAAQMTLHESGARYNIATYKYKDVKLSDVNSLNYRMYDDSASSETPYFHFNVDWANNDTWQGRLVQVPTGVVADTWTTVNALSGMWTKTSGNWPAGMTSNGSLAGSTPRSWADIVADYPNAETRSTDSFLGVRVGHPGPDDETSFVDWIEFDGETTDFEN